MIIATCIVVTVTLFAEVQAWYSDVAFVVDSSDKPDSGVNSWPSIVNFIIAISNYSLPGWYEASMRLALVRYGDEAEVLLNFDQYTNLSSFQRAVRTIAYSPRGGSNLVAALDVVRTRIFVRDGIHWYGRSVAIVITDNLPSTTNNTALKTAAYAAKTAGILIGIVGINESRVDQDLVNQICSYSYYMAKSLKIISTDYEHLVDAASSVGDTVFDQSLLWGDLGTECYAMHEEVAIMIDSSNKTFGSAAFDLMRAFGVSVAHNFAYIGPDLVRLAAVRYSDKPVVKYDLGGDSEWRNWDNDPISLMTYNGGGSNLSAALDLLRTTVFLEARSNVPKVAIVVTDNLQAPGGNQTLLTAIANAKAAGIRLVAVGILSGGRVDTNLLFELGNNYDGKFVAIAPQYLQLDNIVSVVMHFSCIIVQDSATDGSLTDSASSSSPSGESGTSKLNSVLAIAIAVVVIAIVILLTVVLLTIFVGCLTRHVSSGDKDKRSSHQIVAADRTKSIVPVPHRPPPPTLPPPIEQDYNHLYDSANERRYTALTTE